jgi:hypothetical protein
MVPRPMADSLEVGIENVTEFEVEEALVTDGEGELDFDVLSTRVGHAA